MPRHFVRVGCLGEIHHTHSDVPLERGWRVLVRTSRGVELGQVVGAATSATGGASRRSNAPPSARFLRITTAEDEWLIRQLEKRKREAVEACRAALAASGSRSVLLDVDQLFDGGTLLLHFLGPVDEAAESVTAEIVNRYEKSVRTSALARRLTEGCGPGCGTEQGGGCSGCSGCSIAAACHAAAQSESQSTSVRV